MIARVALVLRKLAVDVFICLMVLRQHIPRVPFGTCIFYYVIGVVSSFGCLHINLEERG
jgi:hypothetical protein